MFAGTTIVITGGSSGLGKALAERLIEKGARVALIARDPEKLENVRQELSSMSGNNGVVEVFPCDVSDNRSVDETIARIVKMVGSPDILINSAGILREGYFECQTVDTFKEIMDINFYGTLYCIQAVVPLFKKKGSGRIVNICSVAGITGVFGYSAYCASKHAVRGLTGSLRAELKYNNIQLHIVCPGEFDSPMVDEKNICRSKENMTVTKMIPKLCAEKVADEIMMGIERNQYEIIPGFATRILTGLDRIFPGVGRSISDFKISRVYSGPEDS